MPRLNYKNYDNAQRSFQSSEGARLTLYGFEKKRKMETNAGTRFDIR